MLYNIQHPKIYKKFARDEKVVFYIKIQLDNSPIVYFLYQRGGCVIPRKRHFFKVFMYFLPCDLLIFLPKNKFYSEHNLNPTQFDLFCVIFSYTIFFYYNKYSSS